MEFLDDILAETPHRKISEADFARRWVGMFHGTFTTKKGESPMLLWINQVCKGNVHMHVDVVNTKNEVIWTIPPYVRDMKVEPLQDNGTPPISSLVNRAKMHNDRIPGSGRKFIEAAANRIEIEDYDPESELKMWNEIFVHYGFEAVGDIVEEESEEPAKAMFEDDDDIELI